MIRDHMASLGIAETLRTTETGGIFAMEGGRPGRSVVLRGDIDALPVQEDEARAVHSEVEGVMHACGHDVHVASMLGAASVLAARREDLPGPLHLPLPAGGGGAVRRQGDARARRARPPWRARASSGSTSRPSCPSGFVALRAGIAMSEANSLRITLTGPGRARRHAVGHRATSSGPRPSW